MVKPGVNQVDRMPRDCSSARMREAARAPNSPRDSGVGVVSPREMNPDIVSKSKVRHVTSHDDPPAIPIRLILQLLIASGRIRALFAVSLHKSVGIGRAI